MNSDAASYQRMVNYLHGYYEVPLYQQHGMTHPIIFYAANPQQVQNVDSVLGYIPHESISKDDLTFYNYGFLHSLQNTSRYLYNGVTYALRYLRTNPLRIEAKFGQYFDMIATCAALEQELIDAVAMPLLRLPMRSQYHQTISPARSLIHGEGRSAAIGCAVLVVFNDAGVYKAVVSRRTASHALQSDHYHLLPAFILQPMSATMRPEEWNIRHHVYREWLEELFGMAESDTLSFYNHPALADLLRMQENGLAGLYLSGIAVNLLTLRPEICMVLLIHDPQWWLRVQMPGSPFQLNIQAEARENLILLPVEHDETLMAALPADFEIRTVPQAAVALWEGIRIVRQKINIV